MKSSEIRVMLVNLFLSALLIIGYHFFFVQKRLQRIKIFDLTGHISVLRTLYMENKINDRELASYLQKIRRVLNSQPEGVIVLPAAIVLNRKKVEELKFKDEKLLEIIKRLKESKGGKNEKQNH